MEFQLFGSREVAMFDLWSIAHLLWGIISFALFRKLGASLQHSYLLLFVMVVVWEMIEFSMELGYFGVL